MNVHFNDVDFVLTPDKPKLKIKYTQYNFVAKPERFLILIQVCMVSLSKVLMLTRMVQVP